MDITQAARLRRAMKMKRMSQADLATVTGKSPAAICRYLNGERNEPREFWSLVATALGMDVETLKTPC